MVSTPTILTGALLAVLSAFGALAQDGEAPLESGDVRGLAVTPPPGTRIECFRLDLGPVQDADPVGVVRWISGPDVEDGVTIGRRLEMEVSFFDVDTRVIHTEILRPDERKLVYREVRARDGRTVLLEWSPEGAPRVMEVVGGEMRRRDLETKRGVFLPLYLVELVRAGDTIEGSFAVFCPLAGDVEMRELGVRGIPAVAAPAASPAAERRALTMRRAGAGPAGRYVFEGERLVSFRWQAGGPVARLITAEEYHGWIRRHRADRGH